MRGIVIESDSDINVAAGTFHAGGGVVKRIDRSFSGGKEGRTLTEGTRYRVFLFDEPVLDVDDRGGQ